MVGTELGGGGSRLGPRAPERAWAVLGEMLDVCPMRGTFRVSPCRPESGTLSRDVERVLTALVSERGHRTRAARTPLRSQMTGGCEDRMPSGAREGSARTRPGLSLRGSCSEPLKPATSVRPGGGPFLAQTAARLGAPPGEGPHLQRLFLEMSPLGALS